MKEETITKYIDQLAQSLNVASEHVYEALIKQAMVSGIMSVVWAVIFGIATVIVICVGIMSAKREYDRYGFDHDVFITLIMTLIATSFVVIPFGVAVENALTALLNPEYWAINEVLNAIK
ncbi:hypothetical protein LAU42_09130 [Macrococcus armenti]|uniref:hypothetical protein n=1 Tax=Macrococcus armenti TaxID=2875764 RepID=UPI001CCAC971|nr:hypothetical protein [Macrococcus armenti]UBH21927.1 hypothetical protein LAU42_09130 [Macrococcus armenti]